VTAADAPQRGIRVGYIHGHAVLVLTANRHYALHGVQANTRLSRVARRPRISRPFHVGRNTWYLTANGPSRGVLNVRHGVIEVVGIAPARLTGKWRWGRDRLSGMGRSDWSSVQAAIASLSVTVWPRRWS